ncbi:cold-regulated protein 27-like [Lolium rigidum]|uniref:cold-regulated protein 27-like n=1 Tax=Lolium rigidum TaxID=89674 RepID=UPI001F5DF364|nr:cold-regulated protein 27-like [Lolium rigidum]XP_047073950.1 cold-regulated protein 27-like [Lolium rigidum]
MQCASARYVHTVVRGNQISDLVSAGWTDETHTLYIRSMEASFMDQLYNHGRKANYKDSTFQQTNACAPDRGKCHLPASPWIRHFRPRECSSNTGGGGEEISVGDQESGVRTVHGRTSLLHGRELGTCKAENLLAENAEVSDQNFADDEGVVDAESSKACKKRRLSNTYTYCD